MKWEILRQISFFLSVVHGSLAGAALAQGNYFTAALWAVGGLIWVYNYVTSGKIVRGY